MRLSPRSASGIIQPRSGGAHPDRRRPVATQPDQPIETSAGDAAVTSEPSLGGYSLAGFRTRFDANLLDICVLLLVMMLASLAFSLDHSRLLESEYAIYLIPYYLYYAIIYFAVFWWVWGATPGKLIFGLRVVDESGGPIGIERALVRTVQIPLFLGFIWATFDEQRQGIHDKMAGTYVIDKRRGRATETAPAK